jgi:hypothetical protein
MALTSTRERPVSGWLVLLSPRRAFVGARDKPRAWIALLLLLLISLAPPLAFFSAHDFEAFVLREMKASGQLENVPPDGMKIIEEKVIPAMRVALPVGAAAKRAVWCLVIALLGFALLRGTSKELRFRQCLNALVLAAAPLALHDLFTALIYLVRDAGLYDVRNPVLSNPSAWLKLHPEQDPVGAALIGLDLFSLWAVWLAGLGLAVVSGRKGVLPWLVPGLSHVVIVVGKVANAAVSKAALDAASAGS